MTTPHSPADLTCAELVELITDYLDGALDRETEARFVLHATSCPGCEIYLAQFRATVSALGTLPPETLDEQVRDQLLAAFRGWRDTPGPETDGQFR
ncbi:MAG: zf-HC2 domain-containing protein [Nocardioidaceae bacterium]